MRALRYPVPGVQYTAAQIYRELDLRDAPCLLVTQDGVEGAVQDSHVDDIERLLSNTHFANTRWKYLRTTHEWIPVFRHVPQDGEDLGQSLELQLYEEGGRPALWVTPVGWPRPVNDGTR